MDFHSFIQRIFNVLPWYTFLAMLSLGNITVATSSNPAVSVTCNMNCSEIQSYETISPRKTKHLTGYNCSSTIMVSCILNVADKANETFNLQLLSHHYLSVLRLYNFSCQLNASLLQPSDTFAGNCVVLVEYRGSTGIETTSPFLNFAVNFVTASSSHLLALGTLNLFQNDPLFNFFMKGSTQDNHNMRIHVVDFMEAYVRGRNFMLFIAKNRSFICSESVLRYKVGYGTNRLKLSEWKTIPIRNSSWTNCGEDIGIVIGDYNIMFVISNSLHIGNFSSLTNKLSDEGVSINIVSSYHAKNGSRKVGLFPLATTGVFQDHGSLSGYHQYVVAFRNDSQYQLFILGKNFELQKASLLPHWLGNIDIQDALALPELDLLVLLVNGSQENVSSQAIMKFYISTWQLHSPPIYLPSTINGRMIFGNMNGEQLLIAGDQIWISAINGQSLSRIDSIACEYSEVNLTLGFTLPRWFYWRINNDLYTRFNIDRCIFRPSISSNCSKNCTNTFIQSDSYANLFAFCLDYQYLNTYSVDSCQHSAPWSLFMISPGDVNKNHTSDFTIAGSKWPLNNKNNICPIEFVVIEPKNRSIYLDVLEKGQFRAKIKFRMSQSNNKLDPPVDFTVMNKHLTRLNVRYNRTVDEIEILVFLQKEPFKTGVTTITFYVNPNGVKCPTQELQYQVFGRCPETKHLMFEYPIRYSKKIWLNGDPVDSKGIQRMKTLPINYQPPSKRGKAIPMSTNLYNADPAKNLFRGKYKSTRNMITMKQCHGKSNRYQCGCTSKMKISSKIQYSDCIERVYRLRFREFLKPRLYIIRGSVKSELQFPYQLTELNSRSDYVIFSQASTPANASSPYLSISAGSRLEFKGSGLYHFRAHVVKARHTFCDLTTEFIIFVEGTPLPNSFEHLVRAATAFLFGSVLLIVFYINVSRP